ncbi:Phytanoyl-CoA dioxygenase [Stanieria cyanosphaera PCC 7437]|uniref:Phytanoyl-CoA dioxygenase n=1 Tax=Stanieria cyanosphaera (strain ATCC 29371 / PCC 7437) TaxID=111780 RepID=K9XZP9_STAC7|nr:phytanoyl-CoA dioxygenase family protein [Stanieria cyanosphaera]AFZ37524.1 Phytanoyl-CoA dioxygenase [Stanieria cyanosphaera PCC 7437]
MITNKPTLSSDFINLAKEIIDGKGYVLLPNLLTQAEAKTASNLILELAEQEKKVGKLVIQEQKERLYGLIYQGKIFEKMVQHPTVLSIVETILGQNLILGGFSAHILHPGAKRMGVHVDYPYWAMSSPFPRSPILEIQVIWMVEDFTEDNGAPLFVPHSQKLAIKPELEEFEKTAIKITGKAGTAIISHGLCWHDTSVNHTQKPRVSILGNYTPQFIHPLENNLFNYRQEVIEQATPKLKYLLRHDLQSHQQQIFAMNFKMNF